MTTRHLPRSNPGSVDRMLEKAEFMSAKVAIAGLIASLVSDTGAPVSGAIVPAYGT